MTPLMFYYMENNIIIYIIRNSLQFSLLLKFYIIEVFFYIFIEYIYISHIFNEGKSSIYFKILLLHLRLLFVNIVWSESETLCFFIVERSSLITKECSLPEPDFLLFILPL